MNKEVTLESRVEELQTQISVLVGGVLSKKIARIMELEAENAELRKTIQSFLTAPGYASVDAPLEFTQTPGTYVPISKPSEAEMRARKALLQINEKTIAGWEKTEQMLRDAASKSSTDTME